MLMLLSPELGGLAGHVPSGASLVRRLLNGAAVIPGALGMALSLCLAETMCSVQGNYHLHLYLTNGLSTQPRSCPRLPLPHIYIQPISKSCPLDLQIGPKSDQRYQVAKG